MRLSGKLSRSALITIVRAVALALVAILASCAAPTMDESSGLSISFGDSVSRSILPPISMTPASFAVSGSGPGGAAFSATTSGSSLSVTKLAFGEWAITAEALNADGVVIGSGSATAIVRSNSTTNVYIVIRQLGGEGSLGLTIGWNSGDLDIPRIEASLLPTTGAPRELDFAIAGAQASFSADDLEAGYYTLTVKLLDNGALVSGAVEIVRIVKGEETSGSFFFDKINKPGGTISVNIAQELSDPLVVVLTGAFPTKPSNRSMEIRASLSEPLVNASYVWYVNGESRGSGDSFILDATWPEGWYRVDAVAFSADGTRAGSASASVQVLESSSAYRVSGTIRLGDSPLQGATVSLSGAALSATTGSDGAFAIEGVFPGSYRLETSLAGYTIIPDSYSRSVTVSDDDVADRDFSAFAFSSTSIAAIQGAGHVSPLNGATVSNAIGVVTLADAKQYYMQSPDPDDSAATSEGILVYVGKAHEIKVGDLVAVSGAVSEYYPQSSANLRVTELKSITSTTVLDSGRGLPAPVVIGLGGRIPPTSIICDDSSGSVNSSLYDPESDGIDFYESLEFMRVEMNDAVVVGPTIDYASSGYSETAVVGNGGSAATGMSARGGIIASADDFNPEIMLVNDKFFPAAADYRVGDSFPGSIVGVLDYTYGSFKIFASQALPNAAQGGLTKETTTLSAMGSALTIASYNAENISAVSPSEVLALCGSTIASSLSSPDILVLCEVQDNNGTGTGVTDASASWNAIIAAVAAAGGPSYEYRDIAPVNNADGGANNGNIRQGFLFNPERVSFADRAGGTALDGATVSASQDGALVSFSPGRIDPADAAFEESRKPLIGEFLFQGRKIYVIGNHFNSKGGDQPLWGINQPPILSSEAQRLQQAQIVGDFVDQILDVEPDARIVVAGDLNDFEFSSPILALMGARLVDLVNLVPKADRYSYTYTGNSQVLDHIAVSASLASSVEIDIVHLNAEYPGSERSSDHDPLVARFSF